MHARVFCGPTGAVRLLVSIELEEADFLPTSSMACIFISEPDVINLSASLRARLLQLAKVGLAIVLGQYQSINKLIKKWPPLINM